MAKKAWRDKSPGKLFTPRATRLTDNTRILIGSYSVLFVSGCVAADFLYYCYTKLNKGLHKDFLSVCFCVAGQECFGYGSISMFTTLPDFKP